MKERSPYNVRFQQYFFFSPSNDKNQVIVNNTFLIHKDETCKALSLSTEEKLFNDRLERLNKTWNELTTFKVHPFVLTVTKANYIRYFVRLPIVMFMSKLQSWLSNNSHDWKIHQLHEKHIYIYIYKNLPVSLTTLYTIIVHSQTICYSRSRLMTSNHF